jgi:hypothetical protein
MESWHLQGYRPLLCRLMTKGLIPVSKYWTYWSHARDTGSINWCSQSAIDAWLYPHCLNVCEEREIRWEPTDRSVNVLGMLSGALFLGSSDSVQCCWRVVYVDWHEKCMYHVYQVCPTSYTLIRIIVTLRYEKLLVLWLPSSSKLSSWNNGYGLDEVTKIMIFCKPLFD